jgi:hypothetical protein
MGALRKKVKHTVIKKYFVLEILINVKAGRVDWGARKAYHGCRVGQAWTKLTVHTIVKPEIHLIIFENSVHTSQKSLHYDDKLINTVLGNNQFFLRITQNT